MKKLTALLVLMLTMVLSILPAQAEVVRCEAAGMLPFPCWKRGTTLCAATTK